MDLDMPFAADLVTALTSNSESDLMVGSMGDQEGQGVDHHVDTVERINNTTEQPVKRQG
jgi:hypothetical protein